MSTVLHEQSEQPTVVDDTIETIGDLLDRLGNVSADRVLARPAPGTATEDDLLRLPEETRKVCELIDHTIVRKAVGAPESAMAADLIGFLKIFLKESGRRTIRILGPDGHIRFFGGNIRMPDVAVFLRSRLPQGRIPREHQVCPIAPDWTIEILSPGNTSGEIDKKLQIYFASGVQLAWVVDPRQEIVRVYRSANEFTQVDWNGLLTAESILPGFSLSVREWFEEAD